MPVRSAAGPAHARSGLPGPVVGRQHPVADHASRGCARAPRRSAGQRRRTTRGLSAQQRGRPRRAGRAGPASSAWTTPTTPGCGGWSRERSRSGASRRCARRSSGSSTSTSTRCWPARGRSTWSRRSRCPCRRWSSATCSASPTPITTSSSAAPASSSLASETVERAIAAQDELTEYLDGVIADKLAEPADDLLSKLAARARRHRRAVAARGGADGRAAGGRRP